jgi:hypothetical protein
LSEQDPAPASEAEAQTETPQRGRTWWRNRWVLAGIGAGVVVLLVAGTLVGLKVFKAKPDRSPFEAAVLRLATAPAMHYRTGGGSFSLDVRVTAAGETISTAELAGQKVEMLTVGGKTYVKEPAGLLSGTGDPKAKSRWITGGQSSAAASLGTTATQTQTPVALAQKLITAMNAKSTVFPTGDEPPVTIDGVAAIKAVTPTGDLYVTKQRPYRVLRLAPNAAVAKAHPSIPVPSFSLPPMPTAPDLPDLPSIPPLPSMPAFDQTLAQGLGTTAVQPASMHQASRRPMALQPETLQRAALQQVALNTLVAPSGLGTLDLPAVSAADLEALYNDLQTDTKQLKDAVNSDIDFRLNGNATVHCGPGGCEVQARVTSDVVSSDPDATLSGDVTAQLTATVSIEGEPAGGCTASRKLPLKGSASISCDDTLAGVVFDEVNAQKKAVAEAESEAQGGQPVPYTIQATGQAEVQAIATVKVQALLQQQQLEQDLARLMQIAQDARDAVEAGTGAGTQASPSAAPSPSPSAPPAPLGRSKDEKDCKDSKPAGARTSNKGWILNTAGARGRTERAEACLSVPLASQKSNPSAVPVGYGAAQTKVRGWGMTPGAVLSRCHMIAAQLGGANNLATNLSPCWQVPVNVGLRGFSGFEFKAANQIRALPGGFTLYNADPIYASAADDIPEAYQLFYASYDSSGALVWTDSAPIPNLDKTGRYNLGH